MQSLNDVGAEIEPQRIVSGAATEPSAMGDGENGDIWRPRWEFKSPQSGRLLSPGGWLHCSALMKSQAFQALLVVLLLAGCATQNQIQTTQYQSKYNKPLTSPGAKFGALPPDVQRTVLAEAGPAEVVDAVRDTSSGRVVYKIYFKDSEIFPPLFVAPDGSVLTPNLRVLVNAQQGIRVKPADVPEAVKKAIAEHASSSQVDFINKENWGPLVVYVVTFKDATHNPKLLLAPDGTVVQETQ